MSQYPVERPEGLYKGVNYLLSGPAGLGQNFQGFSSYDPAYLTATYRAPFSVSVASNPSPVPVWYSTPIAVSNVAAYNVQSDGTSQYIKITFAQTQSAPPFRVGQGGNLTGVSDTYPTAPATTAFNGSYTSPYGIVECTTTYCVIETSSFYTWPDYISGGFINTDATGQFNSTDCNARVTVTGPTDQVFITAQLELSYTYTASQSSDYNLTVAVNRYVGFLDTTNPNSQDYLFNLDATVSQRVVSKTVSTSGTDSEEFIFTTVLDQPSFGYYWYILEIEFDQIDGDVEPGVFTAGLRSFTAQVIKQ